MNKKILALALAIVFIATAFTACKKGPELTKINGKDYPLAQDDNGETIINEKNQIAILVTDENKEVIKYEDGEDQTRWLQINGALIIDDKIQTKDHSFNIPEGWQGEESSARVVKDGTNGKCYMQLVQVTTPKNQEAIETYLKKLDEQNESLIPGLKAQGYTLTVEDSTDGFQGRNHIKYVYKITDSNGQIVHYVENYYFEAEKNIYTITYACENGVGYDETFNFKGYLVENFTFKG